MKHAVTLALSLLALGCGSTPDPASDSGGATMDAATRDSGGEAQDSGTDSGPTVQDSGTDSGAAPDDSGVDSGGVDSGGADSGGVDSGAACITAGQRCGGGGTCCEGTMCCAGVPVPPGSEYCGVTCPRCAAPNTPIATPTGERNIADLAVGDLVFSEHEGALVAVPLVEVSRMPVVNHHVTHVVLDSGRELFISPGHPTADGSFFGVLEVGGALGEAQIESVALVPYTYAFTYDILPDSETGTYVAAGALIGSTLRN